MLSPCLCIVESQIKKEGKRLDGCGVVKMKLNVTDECLERKEVVFQNFLSLLLGLVV